MKQIKTAAGHYYISRGIIINITIISSISFIIRLIHLQLFLLTTETMQQKNLEPVADLELYIVGAENFLIQIIHHKNNHFRGAKSIFIIKFKVPE